MDSQINSKTKNGNLQKDLDELYNYLRIVFNKNKTLSTAFMGISLTAFIFLISLGYPDILEEVLIIGDTTIPIVYLSLSILVLSFFFFITSTIIYHYCELNLNSLYLYWYEEYTLSKRYEKVEKLYKIFYEIAGFLLFFGVLSLISAVIFIFLYFSASGLIISIAMFIFFGIITAILYFSYVIKNYLKKKN